MFYKTSRAGCGFLGRACLLIGVLAAVQLDPVTGLVLHPGDVGKRIANRGFTNGNYNGNIEGAEIIYNPGLKQYYLFIAYDWLETKYNVRVARGDRPDGPFYDYTGQDIKTDIDHIPMIIAPYKFNGHGGWQGTAHCTVFDDGTAIIISVTRDGPASINILWTSMSGSCSGHLTDGRSPRPSDMPGRRFGGRANGAGG